MNVNNGQVLEISELESQLHEQFVEVRDNEMTEKQKKSKKVSLKDHTSKLGKQLTNERKERKLGRNDLCICGSGLKNKKCCQKYKV